MTTEFDPIRNTRTVLGLGFAGAGIVHFAHREFFNQLVPKSLAEYARTINVVTGIIQISGAVALFIPRLRNVAQWSNLALLVPTLPATINQVLHPESLEKVGIPPQLTIVRVFAQLCVILVVWRATRAVLPTANTRNGTIQGTQLPSFQQDVFLGVPYAQAPRLDNPKPINVTYNDDTPFDASHYGNTCYGFGSNEI
ncbi:uncharacterized protein N7484_001260 [Penicillium longicatenatum]|uniref:uncharacterized protein n=1 Tax=Penicillium longicatenatum TaxID=1561947 RepID=UPI0025469F5D|nr:uncharacterized protein N7484_001260 [Penicillium longicatenatum]KAJ5657611.1 hypothetical protein N7484_001260 [Penicillium longicatenatum]